RRPASAGYWGAAQKAAPKPKTWSAGAPSAAILPPLPGPSPSLDFMQAGGTEHEILAAPQPPAPLEQPEAFPTLESPVLSLPGAPRASSAPTSRSSIWARGVILAELLAPPLSLRETPSHSL
ncbi:MAG TPA: hypothetical protein VMV73_03865, partial [Candidatus Dormibacteraeota bacterium]|nr:hypothetical protein [Candidatus Dormibacteraeota bacterium]